MNNADVELVDIVLSQAIERYREMEPNEAYDAIQHEWPDQMAMLLSVLFFNATCGGCTGMSEFIQVQRENSDDLYFVPVCSCDLIDRRPK